MNNLIKICLILITVSISSCGVSTNKPQQKTQETIIDPKMANRLALRDSTVSLSFSNIALASHINSIYKAQKNGKLKVSKKTQDSIFCVTNLYYKEGKDPIKVKLNIGYFQDTITGFRLYSDHYDSRHEVIDLYANKYNIDFAETSYNGRAPYLWTFKNQTLKIEETSYVEEEIYIKNAKMRMPENRYGTKRTVYFDKVIISYSDIKQTKKVRDHQIKLAKEDAKRKEREDSIRQAKNNANMKKQDI